jgi:hypothetical protein
MVPVIVLGTLKLVKLQDIAWPRETAMFSLLEASVAILKDHNTSILLLYMPIKQS